MTVEIISQPIVQHLILADQSMQRLQTYQRSYPWQPVMQQDDPPNYSTIELENHN